MGPSPSSRFGLRAIPVRQASMMNTGVLVAAAAVAVGAYALYSRSNTVQTEGQGGKPPFGSFGFRKLKLASSEMVNHDVKKLRFDLGDPSTKSGLTTTSALLTISFPSGGWIPAVLRPYTPVNDLDETGHIDFLVKKYPGGKQSTHLHSMKPGDSLIFFRIPGYSWKVNEQPHVGLIAGGQGITPCYQLARGILKNPTDKTRVTLVWGVNADEDIVLEKELAQMEREYPGRFKVVYAISQKDSASKHAKGRVTKEILESAGVLPGEKGVGKVFLCGPPAMEKVFVGKAGLLSGMGFTTSQVHKF